MAALADHLFSDFDSKGRRGSSAVSTKRRHLFSYFGSKWK
jgi:hypothetical protein